MPEETTPTPSAITRTFRYRLNRWWLYAVYYGLTRMEFVGINDLPIAGPYIVAVNHLSTIDTPLVYVALGKKRDSTGLVADSHKKNPFFRWVVESVGGVWITRGESDRAALKSALAVLKGGRILGLAPEGTRSPVHALQPAKTGIAFLAKHANVPVYPIALWYTDRAFTELKRFRRPFLRVVAGEPLRFDDPLLLDAPDRLQAFTDELMCRIAALLPPEYRGYYADFPRTLELLANSPANITQ
ncbi:MAG TPA: lysophospholipid acyltransferase family protein [Anaerolineales bacterium]|nr:lysophospholipid acyltransferase family protein [Anaerolineales bacterium]